MNEVTESRRKKKLINKIVELVSPREKEKKKIAPLKMSKGAKWGLEDQL